METARPAHWRRARRVLALCVAALGVSAAPALASTTVTMPSPDTLTVVAAPGEVVQVKHTDNVGTGYVQVTTSGTMTPPLPAGCSNHRYDTNTTDPKTVTCPDLPINVFNLTTDSGSSSPVINECFDTANVNLGNGGSIFSVPGCTSGTFNLTTGSGDDLITVLSASAAQTTNHVATNMTLVADLGAGNDHLYGSDAGLDHMIVHGGPGDDRLRGEGGDDQLYGDDGNDQLEGGTGNDRLDGGAGDDIFDFQSTTSDDDPGADEYIGGTGYDKVDFSGHAAAVNVSLNDVADDGSPGEGDNVHTDIEWVLGSSKDDTITGSANADRLDGFTGNDTIHGGDGDDTVLGGDGNDAVYGDGGNDDVEGNDGNDTVDGGTGRDALFGDSQNCSLAVSCATGNDTMFARDGDLDSVTCGLGADSAQVDAIDVVATDPISGCESIDRAASAVVTGPTPGAVASATPGTQGATVTATPTPFTATVTGKPTAAKGVGVSVTCTTACSITATVGLSKTNAKTYKLGTKAVSIGTAKASLKAAGLKKLTIVLSKAAKKKLAKVKKLSVTLTLAVKNAAGVTTTTTTAVTLKK